MIIYENKDAGAARDGGACIPFTRRTFLNSMGGVSLDSNSTQILIAMAIYMTVVIGIGVAFAKRANKSSENYL